MCFLNRLYRVSDHKRAGIITACKIFSKGDVERESRCITLSEKVRSVFGSAAGAVDRGADPVSIFVIATAEATRMIMLAGGKDLKLSTIDTVITAWLPDSLGDWSFPTFWAVGNMCGSH